MTPKLSSLSPTDKIRLAAELDGWKQNPFGGMYPPNLRPECNLNQEFKLPDYSASYDAIIPLIQKVFNRHTCHSFFDALGLIAITNWQDVDGTPNYEGDGSYFEMWVLFKATPSQLLDALLVATGKAEL